MPTNTPELRHRPADSEKITINLGYVDLGHVDLMVRDGFYSNRTDFIRTAIRNQLDPEARETVGLDAILHGAAITSQQNAEGRSNLDPGPEFNNLVRWGSSPAR